MTAEDATWRIACGAGFLLAIISLAFSGSLLLAGAVWLGTSWAAGSIILAAMDYPLRGRVQFPEPQLQWWREAPRWQRVALTVWVFPVAAWVMALDQEEAP